LTIRVLEKKGRSSEESTTLKGVPVTIISVRGEGIDETLTERENGIIERGLPGKRTTILGRGSTYHRAGEEGGKEDSAVGEKGNLSRRSSLGGKGEKGEKILGEVSA